MNSEKKYNIAFALCAVLHMLAPFIILVGGIYGYDCTIHGKAAFLVVIMLLTVILACSIFIFKPKSNKLSILLTAILFISSLADILVFKEYIALACICVVSALVIFATRLPRTVAIIMAVVMSSLIAMLIFFISALGLFGSFPYNEVYNEITSPSGKYTAQIVINDQGALGGSTLVVLKNNTDKKHFLFFTLEKKDVRLYSGKYADYSSISVVWNDDAVLLINGDEYIIEKNDIE